MESEGPVVLVERLERAEAESIHTHTHTHTRVCVCVSVFAKREWGKIG